MTESDFEISSREPLMWLRSARTRRMSARIIKRELDPVLVRWSEGEAEDDEVWIWQDYLLLAAHALENLLKGILIGRDPAIVRNGKLNWASEPHNLGQLASKMAIGLTRDERELLDRLTEVIAWGGRYPVPYKEKRLGRTSELDQHSRRATTYVTTDEQIFEGLFGKLETQLTNERQEREL